MPQSCILSFQNLLNAIQPVKSSMFTETQPTKNSVLFNPNFNIIFENRNTIVFTTKLFLY